MFVRMLANDLEESGKNSKSKTSDISDIHESSSVTQAKLFKVGHETGKI